MNLFSIALFAILLLNPKVTMNNISDGDLVWRNFTDGIREASASNKKVLVDVYTDWCGWCKRMEKDTYSDEDIKNYLTANYVIVRLNAESDAKEMLGDAEVTEATLAKAYGVTGYPTMVFLMPDGKFITSVAGYMKPSEFLPVLKYICEDYYKQMNYQDYLNSRNAPAK